MLPLLKPVLYLLLSVVFIGFFAQIAYDVPWSDTTIPISGQTFAVLVVGMLLGKVWGTLAVVIYLLIGGLGLPVFADGGFGWESFEKGTGGFLIGFAVAAFVVGYLAEQGWSQTFSKCLYAMLIGTLVIMAFGVAYLTHLYGFGKGLEYGFYPFVPGAILKIFLGALVVFYLDGRRMKSEDRSLPG